MSGNPDEHDDDWAEEEEHEETDNGADEDEQEEEVDIDEQGQTRNQHVKQLKGKLRLDGHIYIHDEANDDGDMVAWKCQKNGCPGTAVSFMEADEQNTIQKLAVAAHNCLTSKRTRGTKRQSTNSNPETAQTVDNEENMKIAAYTIELTGLLLALDDEFVFSMLQLDLPVGKKLIQHLVWPNGIAPNEQQTQETGQQLVAQPQDEWIDGDKLKTLLPKSDESQVVKVVQLLNIDAQHGQAITGEGNDGQMDANTPTEATNVIKTNIDLLPLLALEKLIASRPAKEDGFEVAFQLKHALVDSGILCVLVDYLAYSTKQLHRHGVKQLGFIQFYTDTPKITPASKSKKAKPKKKSIRKKPYPFAGTGYAEDNDYPYMEEGVNNWTWTFDGKQGKVGGTILEMQQSLQQFLHGYSGGGASTSAQPKLAAENEAEFIKNKEKERLVECLFNVLNQFLLGTDMMPMDQNWLAILRQSCLRNTIREYLMNGNLDDLIGKSSTFGSILELLKTLAQAQTVVVENMDIFKPPSNDSTKAKNEERSISRMSNGADSNTIVLSPFNTIFDEELIGVDAPGPSSSSSSAAVTILELLRNFASSIDDHSARSMSLFAGRNLQDEELQQQNELVYLGSLSFLCGEIIKLVEEQNQIVASLQIQTSTPLVVAVDQLVPSSSSQSTSTSFRYPLRRSHKISPTGVMVEKVPDVDSSSAAATSSSAPAAADVGVGEDEQKKYCDALKDLQFDTISFGVVEKKAAKSAPRKKKQAKKEVPMEEELPDIGGTSAATTTEAAPVAAPIVPHFFRDSFGQGGSVGVANVRMKHISRAMFSLRSGLQLSYSTAAFVRMSEEYIDAFKVLITGPAGTPYENGCFEFDFYLNENFPNVPPKVNLMTTGHGTVRFNPNLYNCGKVCLSLLGTWSGQQCELWDPSKSTILQVITSIQSLILVPQPYFNEPGYERSQGTKQGNEASDKYNVTIRRHTAQWAIVDQLRHPPAGFELVVRRHFWLKRAQIRAQLEEWGATKEIKTQLEKELKKLEGMDIGLGQKTEMP